MKGRFGLYTSGKEPQLFYTTGGSFATNSFIEKGNCDGIIGESFPAYFAEDGKQYNINKRDVTIISDEEAGKLLKKADPAFVLIVELSKMQLTFIQKYRLLTYGPTFKSVLDEGLTVDDIKDFILNG